MVNQPEQQPEHGRRGGAPLTRRASLAVGVGAVLAGTAGGYLAQSGPKFVDRPEVGASDWRSVFLASDGDDSNDGLSAERAVRTLPRALHGLGDVGGVVILRSGDTVELSEPVALDVSRHRVSGSGSILDASKLSGGRAALTLFGSIPQPLFQPWEVLQGVRLQGPGKETDSVGISLDTEVSTGRAATAHVQLSNLAVEGFGIGVEIRNNAYCITFFNCIIGKCWTCLRVSKGTENSGERIEVLSSTIFDSEVGIEIQSRAAEVFAIGSSIDYCRRLVVVTNGRAHVVSCHLEFDKSRDVTPIEVSGEGGLVMLAGKIVAVSKSGPPAVPYIVRNDSDPLSSTTFSDVWMINLSTTTGYFAAGKGHTQVRGELTEAAEHRSFAVLSEAGNLLADGSFSESIIVDEWYGLSNPRSVATRGEVPLEVIDHDDGRALLVRRRSSSDYGAVLMVPVQRGSIPRLVSDYRLDSSTGIVRVFFEAALVRLDGTANIARTQPLGDELTLSASGDAGWARLRSSLPLTRAAPWATHYLMRLDLRNLPIQGTLQLRNVIVSAT